MNVNDDPPVGRDGSQDGRLLRGFNITHVLDCPSDPRKIRAVASFSDHVDGAFPYLNAILPEAAYNPAGQTMMLKQEGRLITLYPHMATIAKAWDEEDAGQVLAWLCERINDVWAHREEIEPCYERRQVLRPLDIYSLLPRTNCSRCGEATCMAFAFGLLQGERGLEQCPSLDEAEHQARRERLASLLGESSLLRAE